jgi:hypothetical protein
VCAISLDQDAHGVFMVVATLMGNICHKLIEISLLDLLQSISDAMQNCILWCMGANGEASTTLVTPTSLKARAIALATEAGKPDAWLTMRSCLTCLPWSRFEVDPNAITDRAEIFIDVFPPSVMGTKFAVPVTGGFLCGC